MHTYNLGLGVRKLSGSRDEEETRKSYPLYDLCTVPMKIGRENMLQTRLLALEYKCTKPPSGELKIKCDAEILLGIIVILL